MKKLFLLSLVFIFVVTFWFCGSEDVKLGQWARAKATLGDMKTIGSAIEDYMSDYYMAPGAGELTKVSDLKVFLEPFYIKVLPITDGWGNPLVYASGKVGTMSQECYSIISYGRDGKDSGMDINNSPYLLGSVDDFNKDICYSNGSFTYHPSPLKVE